MATGQWHEATLGEVCDFRAGSVFKLRYQGQDAGDYPFIKVSDMNLPKNRVSILEANNWVVESVANASGAKPLPSGTIVFAKIGEALRHNRLRRVVQPTVVDNNMMGAIPRVDTVNPRFLFYAMHQFDLGEFADGTALPYLTVASLAKLPLLLPPMSEQRAIAHVLGTLDDKIELNRRMNETLEEMARALFKSWFVDLEPVRAKAEGRWRRGESLPGLPAEHYDLFPDRLVDSELGEVPEGWGIGVLNDAIEILSGGTPKTSVLEYWGGGIPWYTAKDAPSLNDLFVLTTERSISQAGVENSSTKVLPAGTTVITARGTVGRLACLGTPMAMNQTCYGLRGASGYPDYFTYWNVRNTVSDLQARTHGTIFDTITRATFKIAETVLAPVSVARAFESALGPLMDRILQNLNESSTLMTQRDALLPGLVSGELKAKGLNVAQRRDH